MTADIANSATNAAGAAGAAVAFPSNPFVGLRPFNSGEALLFFGRGEQTVELLRRLHRDHFIAVVGSSGCGKSSLVRAGLIPKLRAGFLTEDRDQWLVAVMKPGDAPLRNLAAALIEAIPAGVGVENCAEAIRDGGAHAVIEQLSTSLAHSDANLLLLVDQFEEIFRFGVESGKPERRDEAEDFVSIMLALAEQRRLPIYVVMTMRSDFLGDCDHFHGLPEAMNRGQYMVPRLTRQQRRQAIEGPILLFGASISPRLLDRLLNDVGDKSDQLPVMQHALMRTWEEWERESTGRRGDSRDGLDDNPQSGQVDLPHYETAGGINGALSKDAEAALEGMSAEELKITERMFQALSDTDARNRRVRRPAHMSEIMEVTGANRAKVLGIVERFRGGGRSFLNLTEDDDPLIDISHESLIRQWERMSEWVKSEAESRDLYLRLVDSAKKGRELWRGSDLAEILRWRERKQPNMVWARRYHKDKEDEAKATFGLAYDFLEGSKLQEELETRDRERERKRKLRNTRAVALILAIAFLLALLSALYARKQTTIANEQRKVAEEAQIKLFTMLARSIANRGEVLFGSYAAALGIWINSDGSLEALGNVKPTDDEWKLVNSLKTLNKSLDPLGYASQDTAPQGSDVIRLQENARDFQQIWERVSMSTPLDNDMKKAVPALLVDLQSLIDTGLRLHQAGKLRNVAMENNAVTLYGHESYVSSVAFSPDGKTLATGSYDMSVKLWDLMTRQYVATLNGHEGLVYSVAFSPDGKTLATGSADKSLKLWDLMTRQYVATLNGHEGPVHSVAFSPDGKTLATGSADKSLKLWDLMTRQYVATLRGHEGPVLSVAFSPDGKTLATGSADMSLKLWDLMTRQNVATRKGSEGLVLSVAFSPDGKALATGASAGSVKLWDVMTRQILATFKGHEGLVYSVAFSPDGKTLATGSADMSVKLWDLMTRQYVATLNGHKGPVLSVAFSPDGKTLATGSADMSLKLWDETARQ